jgi:hypothetical protein
MGTLDMDATTHDMVEKMLELRRFGSDQAVQLRRGRNITIKYLRPDDGHRVSPSSRTPLLYTSRQSASTDDPVSGRAAVLAEVKACPPVGTLRGRGRRNGDLPTVLNDATPGATPYASPSSAQTTSARAATNRRTSRCDAASQIQTRADSLIASRASVTPPASKRVVTHTSPQPVGMRDAVRLIRVTPTQRPRAIGALSFGYASQIGPVKYTYRRRAADRSSDDLGTFAGASGSGRSFSSRTLMLSRAA